jgi:signal peptidase I
LILAVVLAVVVRHFALEAFEIPTGSMAPTLYGMHFWTECPNCATEYNIAVSSDAATGRVTSPTYRETITEDGQARVAEVFRVQARCPNCEWEYTAREPISALRSGNKIFVNKFAFQARPPQRFDVIVFEFDQWKNYIKRLVGLPGETIQIFDGDIYVDGKIVRKSEQGPGIQDSLWREISDSDIVEESADRTPAWEELSELSGGTWSHGQMRTRWSVNHAGGDRPPAVLTYRRRFDNFLSYNLLSVGSNGPQRWVGDRKIEFTVTALAGTGWVGVEIRDGRFLVTCRIPVAGAESGSTSPGRKTSVEVRDTLASGSGAALALESDRELTIGRATKISFANVDDQAILWIDDEEIADLDFVSCDDLDGAGCEPASSDRRAHSLQLLGHGVQAELRSIRIFRDIYYVGRSELQLQPGTRWTRERIPRIRLGQNEYLALGDNTTSSSDSRVWGVVPEKNLMGKALLVFWPAWPLNFQCKFIR